MHILDGALSLPVLLGASTLAVAGIAKGARELDLQRIPAAGLLSAVFFVASLVHVPIGPSSLHLIMNGLAGLILGWVAFPALFIGLLLQAVLFGFGGLTVLGVNTLNIALPAVIVFYLCRRGVAGPNATLAAVWGATAGALAIALTALGVAAVLALSGEAFIPAAKLVVIGHVPVMLVEGLLCAAAVTLIRRVRPDLLGVMSRSASASASARATAGADSRAPHSSPVQPPSEQPAPVFSEQPARLTR
ncbi:cobalt transporter CbiM [Halochromatium glycolicum]|uniref:Cobalamin biosynthesis protein CbiM n=1 Tax=Halochromatium glycolicum TaxID=85075 RepID=A0AAJ0U7I1_9GAMM|nr:cobalamin biosynthesis protein CbiM [Halochromatium glycolicum]